MSSAPDSHGHDAHAFTGEPIQVLPADEPRTPGWLPLVGIALFTGAAVMFLAGRDDAPAVAAQGHPEAPASATAAAVMARPAAPAAPMPAGAAPSAAPRALTPEQRQQMLKALGERRANAPAAPH